MHWVTTLAAVLVVGVVPAWSAPPSLSFEDQAVVISGVTPGGSVAAFGVSRGFNGFTGYVLRHDEVLTAGADGVARLELELLPVRSAFSAVDLATGEVGFGAPEPFELRQRALAPESIDAGGGGLTERRSWVYALWARPQADAGAGAWGAIVGDGGATDADGVEDGVVRAAASSFVPIEADGSAPPEALAAGDVVVVIDPETLEVAATRLSG
jgi:hypothetical protein